MNLAELIRAAFPLSIALIVLSLGLRCTVGETTFLFRERGLLARSVVAMNVLQPIAAILLAAMTHVHPAVKIALVALAVSPVPPVLPRKQLKLVTRESYVYGLLVATSVLAIVLVPVTIGLLGALSGRTVHVAPGTLARIVVSSVLAPLALGMLIRRLWPALAAEASPVASAIGTLVLAVAAVVALIAVWPAISSLIGNGTLLVCVVFAIVALAIGHTLGGPNDEDRTVLALASASRHPGVAIAIGAAAFPDQKLVPAAVVLYLLASTVVAAPYAAWRKRLRARMTAKTPA
jgi:bile acid:Na+ symporter, BASS family